MMIKKRESGIELLKIIAIFLIVISHSVQTLHSSITGISSSYVIDLNQVTNNVQYFILAWFRHFGSQGNLIFFVCSAWFLLDDNKVNKKKIFYMLASVWSLNVLFAIIFFVIPNFSFSIDYYFKALFPNIFELNWYITYYILFYMIHSFLNIIINSLSKRQLLVTSLLMLVLYFGIDYLHFGHFAFNNFVVFIVVYFVIAYIKKYLTNYCANKKLNFVLLIVSILAGLLLMLVVNALGMRFDYFKDELMYWDKNNSPVMLLMAISLFNLFKNLKFSNKYINYLSSLSLLVYIIHANNFVKMSLRPLAWKFIYEQFGYQNILLLDLVYSLIMFVISVGVAILFKETVEKYVHKICDKTFDMIDMIASFFNKIIDYIANFE